MSLRHFLKSTRLGLILFITQALFFVFCGIVMATVPTNLPYTVGADASTWIMPAESLLLHKDYVMYDHPEYDYLYRPPLYLCLTRFVCGLAGSME